MTHRTAYALLLGVALLWSGNFPLAKLGLHELGPITMAATRALIAAPLLVLVSLVLEGPLPPLARRDLTAVMVLAVTGFVGNSTLWYIGLRSTTPANAGILGAASPVVVALAASAWLRERLSTINLVGIGLTLAAVLLTIARGSPEILLTLSVNRGDVIILASQTLWVIYTLYSRANLSTFSPLQMLAGAHVIAAGLLLPWPCSSGRGRASRTPRGWGTRSSSTARCWARRATLPSTRRCEPWGRDGPRCS